MRCPNCQRKISGDTNFCPSCGAQLPPAPEKPERELLSWRRAVFGTAGASMVAMALFRLVGLMAGTVYSTRFGYEASAGQNVSALIVGLWSTLLIWGGHIAFTAVGVGRKTRSRVPWFVAWGVLCTLGTALWLFCSVYGLTLAEIFSTSPGALPYAVESLRWEGLFYGLGFPLFQGALVVSFWGRGWGWKAALVTVVFLVTLGAAAWLGVWVLSLGVMGLMLLVLGPVHAAVVALLLGWTNGKPKG